VNQLSCMCKSRMSGLISRLLIIGVLVFVCLQPTLSTAATTPPRQQQEQENSITLLNIALFYAGLIGVVVGVTTGWVSLLFQSGPSEPLPAPPAETDRK
jgi:hypothetical protein